MEAWEIGLLAVAGFVAVRVLARMMLARRNMVYERLLAQAEAEQARKQKEAEKNPDDGKQTRAA